MEDECILDTCRFFDETTHQYGYEVKCLNPEHKDRDKCPGEREIFRLMRED